MIKTNIQFYSFKVNLYFTGKEHKTHEFYLGRWSEEDQLKLSNEIKASQETKEKLKTTKVQGILFPSVEVVMSDGNYCFI